MSQTYCFFFFSLQSKISPSIFLWREWSFPSSRQSKGVTHQKIPRQLQEAVWLFTSSLSWQGSLQLHLWLFALQKTNQHSGWVWHLCNSNRIRPELSHFASTMYLAKDGSVRNDCFFTDNLKIWDRYICLLPSHVTMHPVYMPEDKSENFWELDYDSYTMVTAFWVHLARSGNYSKTLSTELPSICACHI